MPQMFPLLWLYLFSAIMFALLIMMAYLHFIKSPLSLETKLSVDNKNPLWKW